MKKALLLVVTAGLVACGGGGGDGGPANDAAIVGTWGYRTDGLAYDTPGCGGTGVSGVVQRVRETFDGTSFTQLFEECTATANGNQFQATDNSVGTYTTGAVVHTITYSANGAIQNSYSIKAIDVYNTTVGRQTYSSYYINDAGQLVLAVNSGANNGSTSSLRRTDVENGFAMTKLD